MKKTTADLARGLPAETAALFRLAAILGQLDRNDWDLLVSVLGAWSQYARRLERERNMLQNTNRKLLNTLVALQLDNETEPYEWGDDSLPDSPSDN